MAENTVEERLGSTVEVTPPRPFNWRSRVCAIVVLAVLVAAVAAFAATVGPASISFVTVWKIVLSKLSLINYDAGWSAETIVWETRLPRIILAGGVGIALAASGATYQGIFRNPLADPYLLGVAYGAALGATIGMVYFGDWGGSLATTPLLAFLGGILAIVVVYSIARSGGSLPATTLILAGVAVNMLFYSIQAYMMQRSEQKHQIIDWTFGSFNLTDWNEVAVALPLILVGTVFLWTYARPLNVMQLDEDQAQQLGINVERVKVVLLLAATLITAAAISFCGIIGFVGIIVPHAVRMVWGPDHRFLLPLAALVGAVLMITVDTLARTVIDTNPGIITAALGAPFFIYLLRRKKSAIY